MTTTQSVRIHTEFRNLILASIRDRGRPPTVRELGAAVNLSTGGVAYQLQQMRRLGLIEVVDRSIRLVGPRCECCAGTGIAVEGPTVAQSVACSHPKASETVSGELTQNRADAMSPVGGGTDEGVTARSSVPEGGAVTSLTERRRAHDVRVEADRVAYEKPSGGAR